jgi:hypothetical protein
MIAEPVNGNDDPPPPPEPVFTVIGNVEPSPLVNVIVFNDTEAVISKDPVSSDVITEEPATVKVWVATTLPVITKLPDTTAPYGIINSLAILYCSYK